MTPRQVRIGQFALSVAFAALGIWGLADARYVSGAIYLAIAVAWLLFSAFKVSERVAARRAGHEKARR